MKKNKPTKNIWVTKDGQRVHVKDLGDTHLTNLIKLVIRKGKQAQLCEIVAANSISMLFQGEMAQLCAARDIDAMENEHINNYLERRMITWESIKKEAFKRKLVDAIEVLHNEGIFE